MSGSVRPRFAAVSLILALTSTTSGAWHPPQQPQFKSGVTRVEVYAAVSDDAGRAVKGLKAEDFTVLEDGVPQNITAFISGEFPASVALAVDRSFSMKGTPLTMAKTAGRVFVATLRPEDRVMLISISGEVEVLAPFDTDRTALLTALGALDAWSTTSLHDAMVRSIQRLESESGRRALVLLSDGEDRYSSATPNDVLDVARASDVMVYPIAIGRTRPPLFPEVAAITGGRSFHLRDPKELQPTLQAIAEDIRSQYLIGYDPPPVTAGVKQWRSIVVRVNRPGLAVRARSGYIAN